MEGGPEFKDSLSHIARGRKNKGKKERKRGGGRRKVLMWQKHLPTLEKELAFLELST